jgi:uncharacterized protein YjiK
MICPSLLFLSLSFDNHFQTLAFVALALKREVFMGVLRLRLINRTLLDITIPALIAVVLIENTTSFDQHHFLWYRTQQLFRQPLQRVWARMMICVAGSVDSKVSEEIALSLVSLFY